MKRFKTNQGIIGVQSFGEEVTSRIISELLTEHRNKLIRQANASLENYVEWKFKKQPSDSQVRVIRALLEQLKDCRVYIEEMPELLEELAHKEVVELSDEPFEKQIDEQIARILEHAELPWEQYL